MGNDKGAKAAGRGRAKGLLAWLSRNKGILILTVPTVIVVVGIALMAMLLVVMVGECDLLAGHMSVFPDLVIERSDMLTTMSAEYIEDCCIKGDIGALLFDEFPELADSERLERIRSSVSAVDVSLVEPDGTIVATTRKAGSYSLDQKDVQTTLAADLHFTSRFGSYASGQEELEAVPATITDEAAEETGESAVAEGNDADGTADQVDWDQVELDDVEPVMEAVELGSTPPALYSKELPSGRSLVYEFDFTNLGTYLLDQGGWENTLKEMLAGLDAYCFAYFPDFDSVVSYPVDKSLLEEEKENVKSVFVDNAVLVDYPDDRYDSLLEELNVCGIKLQGRDYFAMCASLPNAGVKLMVAVPMEDVVGGIWHACNAFCVFVVLSLVLLVVYLKRTRAQELDAGEVVGVGLLRKRGLVGFVVALVSTAAIFVMFILLEVTASTAAVTKNQRESLQYQVEYDEKLREQTQKEYIERGVTRNNALAQLLSSSPDLRNRETLIQLNNVVGAQYLMLFDKNGKELFSTNAYNGMDIGTEEDDPSIIYRQVLMGSPYIVTETVHDDILDTDTHTIASLVTDGEGLADGILLMCVGDENITWRLDEESIESTVRKYPVQDDQVALVVDDESGMIVGHTDDTKVEELATNYIDASLLGRSYEGFTFFDGNYAYVSEDSVDGRSTLLVSHRTIAVVSAVAVSVIVIAIFLVLYAIYYLLVTYIVAHLEPGAHHDYRGRPLLVFVYGYVIYFFLLSIHTLICSLRGTWPSFGFVHGSQWSHGVHLFSIWAALFSVCATLMVVFAAKAVLRHLEKTSTLEARTLLRLANSIVTYGAVIICGFTVLSMLGVDTAALLASAGIVSIAIGMGSKDLITDILAGIFLVSEGSIHVGDIVTVGGWRGRITDMGVRTCEITNDSHDVKIVTNSRINEIVNSSRRRTLCSEDIELKRTVDVDEVPALVDAIIAAVTDEIPELDGTLHMEEITGITEDSYKVRLTYKCDENERESLTFRLKNALQLLLEDGTEELEEAAGIDSDEGKADSAANAEAVPVKGDDKPSTPETA